MRSVITFFLMVVLIISTGCASAPPTDVRFSWEFYSSPTITPETFSGQNVAILPTASIEYDPTQEIYRETLAGTLYTALRKHTGGPHFLSLDAIQSGINSKELWNDFKLMYGEYQKTAVLRKIFYRRSVRQSAPGTLLCRGFSGSSRRPLIARPSWGSLFCGPASRAPISTCKYGIRLRAKWSGRVPAKEPLHQRLFAAAGKFHGRCGKRLREPGLENAVGED